jgi:hypothetical protein
MSVPWKSPKANPRTHGSDRLCSQRAELVFILESQTLRFRPECLLSIGRCNLTTRIIIAIYRVPTYR